MVRSSAAVALDRGKGGGVQSTSRRGCTGGESATRTIGAGAREVSKPATVLMEWTSLGKQKPGS